MNLFFDEVFKRFNTKKVRILDVGGTVEFWETFIPQEWMDSHITILNLNNSKEESKILPNYCVIQGDARQMPQFKDDEFDVVFSNSVIEHVGTLRDQKKMADECMRIGNFCFIQAPCRRFPIESHFNDIPFFYWMPKRLQLRIITKQFRKHAIEEAEKEAMLYLDSVRLLNEYELRMLFPKLTVRKEKVFGLTKSYMLYGTP
jgi:hypothetical protein